MSNGKGDTPRPAGVSASTWAENYARTFGTQTPAEVLRQLDAALANRCPDKAPAPDSHG